jgi:hypothetical protein
LPWRCGLSSDETFASPFFCAICEKGGKGNRQKENSRLGKRKAVYADRRRRRKRGWRNLMRRNYISIFIIIMTFMMIL